MLKMDTRGNIILPWGDTMLVSMKISGTEIPEGTKAVFAIRKTKESNTIFQKNLEIVDNRATIYLSNEESESLKIGKYLWDIRLVTTIETEKVNVISLFSPNMPVFEVSEVAVDV